MRKLPKIRPKPFRHGSGFKIHFSFNGKQHKKYVGNNEYTAYILQSRLNNLVAEFKCGIVTVPAHLSIHDFIFSSIFKPPKCDSISRQETITQVSNLIDKYLEYTNSGIRGLSRNTIKAEVTHISNLKKFIEFADNDPSITNVKLEYFDDYKLYRKSPQGGSVKNDTINKELRTFTSMWNFAIQREWASSNVVKKVKRDPSEVPPDRFRTTVQMSDALQRSDLSKKQIKEVKRYRYLSLSEVEDLINTVRERLSEKSQWFLPVLITYCYTGIRRSELTKIQWSHINFERNSILVKSSKQSKSVYEESRIIHIAPKLKPILLKQKENRENEWVFPSPKGGQMSVHTLASILPRVLKGTKFEGIGYHCFRHSFVSNLAHAKVDARIIASLTGHKTQQMIERYTHPFDEAKEEAINKLCLATKTVVDDSFKTQNLSGQEVRNE